MRFALFVTTALCALATMAQEKDYCLNVKDFSELTVANNISVSYQCHPDSAGYAIYRCDPSKAAAIVFSNDKNKLKIQVIADTPIDDLPIITLYSLALTKVTNWGDSAITVSNPNPGAKLKVKVIGNGEISVTDVTTTKIEAAVEAGSGHIFVSGKAKEAKYNIASAGAIEAASLEAEDVKCNLYGTGSIDCWATEKLSIAGIGAGSGKIFYKGSPSVTNRGIGIKATAVK